MRPGVPQNHPVRTVATCAPRFSSVDVRAGSPTASLARTPIPRGSSAPRRARTAQPEPAPEGEGQARLPYPPLPPPLRIRITIQRTSARQAVGAGTCQSRDGDLSLKMSMSMSMPVAGFWLASATPSAERWARKAASCAQQEGGRSVAWWPVSAPARQGAGWQEVPVGCVRMQRTRALARGLEGKAIVYVPTYQRPSTGDDPVGVSNQQSTFRLAIPCGAGFVARCARRTNSRSVRFARGG